MEIKQIREYEEIKNEIINLKDIFEPLFERINIEEYVKKLSLYASVYILKTGAITYGLAAIYMNDEKRKIAYISLIGIARKYQRMNLGTLLIHYCMEKARESGMKTLKLEVDKKNNSAISFYKKEGLKIIGEGSKNSYYMEKEVM